MAPEIRKREANIAQLEARLRAPRAPRPNLDVLRSALEQRAQDWKVALRAEPKVARLILRRIVGPITLWDSSQIPEWMAPPTEAEYQEIV